MRDWLSHPADSLSDDTIVALSTPPGPGALALVRMTGSGAVEIGDRIFDGRARLRELESHHTRLGFVKSPLTGERLDQVLAQVMRAPRTFTGEDMVEFSGHGGNLAFRMIVEAAVDAGARPAEPGEFTRRAFLNGRIDLAQAEAVADLIHARGARALRNALSQLDGGLSRRLEAVHARLLDVLAPLEAFIDFGDDVPEPPRADLMRRGIEAAREGIQELLAGRARGRLMMEGATVALVGRPNVGKSSLLNALSGRDRALVHDTPGTTRDTVDVEVSVDGFPVRLVDTAGMRRTPDPVESAGVERARQAFRSADLSLMVIDASAPPEEDDLALAELVPEHRCLLVRNKIDLGDHAASRVFAAGLGTGVFEVSARTGEGVTGLLGRLPAEIGLNGGQEETTIMTRERHYEALKRSSAALDRAERLLREKAFTDMVAGELREAMASLGEITGRGVGPEVLDRIFTSFCIGK